MTGTRSFQDHGRGAARRRQAQRLAPLLRVVDRWRRLRAAGEAGMSTAEYAVGTVAACAFAAVLYRVVTGGSVVSALGHLVQRALETLS